MNAKLVVIHVGEDALGQAEECHERCEWLTVCVNCFGGGDGSD